MLHTQVHLQFSHGRFLLCFPECGMPLVLGVFLLASPTRDGHENSWMMGMSVECWFIYLFCLFFLKNIFFIKWSLIPNCKTWFLPGIKPHFEVIVQTTFIAQYLQSGFLTPFFFFWTLSVVIWEIPWKLHFRFFS